MQTPKLNYGNAQKILDLLLKVQRSTHINSLFGAFTFKYASEGVRISKQSPFAYVFDHVIRSTQRMITSLVCLDVFDHLNNQGAANVNDITWFCLRFPT